jgi:hypothetical protein
MLSVEPAITYMYQFYSFWFEMTSDQADNLEKFDDNKGVQICKTMTKR